MVVVVVLVTLSLQVMVCREWVAALAAMERLAKICDQLPWDQDTFDRLVTNFLYR